LNSELRDSSQREFWDVRYARHETPWDFHGVPAHLERFLRACPPARVLIPGCGRAYEVRAFNEAGWEVTAMDFSPEAVEQARRHLGELANRVLQADFFKHNFGGASFDLVYERTFLCALPPRLWSAYVGRVAQLLRPGGRLAGFFLYGVERNPPPYPLSEAEAREVLGAGFSLQRSLPVADSLPLFAGREKWQEWSPR
jgi:SAM-dependent methyltransferase